MDRVDNILFYSEHCPHCRSIIDLILKRNIKEQFLFVCVDQHRTKIPPQIDRVPALIMKDEGKPYILFEDDIIRYIGEPPREETINIEPVDQSVSAYSENFSFLEDDGGPSTGSKNFALFGQEQKIYTPDEDDENGKIGGDGVLDRFMNQRAQDVSSIFGDNNKRV